MNSRIISLICLTAIFVAAVKGETFETLYWNKGRSYDGFRFSTSDGLRINNQGEVRLEDKYRLKVPASSFHLTFRASNANGNPNKRYPYLGNDGIIRKKGNPQWGFYILNEEGDSLIFHIDRTEKENIISSNSAVRIHFKSPFTDELTVASEEPDSHSEFNLWQLQFDRNTLMLTGGRQRQENLISLSFPSIVIKEFGFFAEKGADITITDISLKYLEAEENITQWENIDQIATYLLESNEDIEGFWALFDRELEETLLKPGGDYILAILKNQSDERLYDMIYLSGSIIHSSSWHPGRIKGHLSATLFDGIYDVEWIDAEGNSMQNGIKAQTGEAETLEIQFPYHNSKIRLRKVDPEKINFN